MMNDEPIILSEEGRRRQQRILEASLHASKLRRRRTSVKTGLGFCALVLALWPVIYVAMRKAPVEQPIVIVQPTPVVQKTAEPLVIVQHIETDPNIVQRLSLPPITSTIRHIGDAELMRELADAHQSAGLISVNGKTQLIYR